jgi:hypothetical protein
MGHDSSFLPLLHRPPRAVDPTASPGTCQEAEGVTWRSRSPAVDAIRAFAGDDIDAVVLYPEDAR